MFNVFKIMEKVNKRNLTKNHNLLYLKLYLVTYKKDPKSYPPLLLHINLCINQSKKKIKQFFIMSKVNQPTFSLTYLNNLPLESKVDVPLSPPF
jgi:hypothetical protein